MKDDGIQYIANTHQNWNLQRNEVQGAGGAPDRQVLSNTECDIGRIKKQEAVENCVVRSFIVCIADNVMG